MGACANVTGIYEKKQSFLKVFFVVVVLQSERQDFLLTEGKCGRVRGLRIIEND